MTKFYIQFQLFINSDNINWFNNLLKKNDVTMLLIFCFWSWNSDSLRELFTMFGYEIGLHENKTCLEIRHLLDEVRKKDHKDNGALVVCILSHGDFNTITGACSEDLVIEEIMTPFRADCCPSLSGKPKLFIFQICQGQKTQPIGMTI